LIGRCEKIDLYNNKIYHYYIIKMDVPIIIVNKTLRDKRLKTNTVAKHTNFAVFASGKKATDEELPIMEKNGRESGQMITNARVKKGWKQDEAAKNLNMPLDIYRTYESGTAIKNGAQLNKIGSVLGIKLNL